MNQAALTSQHLVNLASGLLSCIWRAPVVSFAIFAFAILLALANESWSPRRCLVGPAGRAGHPQDIAHAVVFLADEEKAGFIDGCELMIDGGVSAKLVYPD